VGRLLNWLLRRLVPDRVERRFWDIVTELVEGQLELLPGDLFAAPTVESPQGRTEPGLQRGVFVAHLQQQVDDHLGKLVDTPLSRELLELATNRIHVVQTGSAFVCRRHRPLGVANAIGTNKRLCCFCVSSPTRSTQRPAELDALEDQR